MRRKILIVLLSIGTVGGYAAGFASMRRHACHRREAFENHVVQKCADEVEKKEHERWKKHHHHDWNNDDD